MRFRKMLAAAFLRATGWKPEGAPPDERRFVLIAAPHTSNWDLAYLLALAEVYDLRISFMMKHTIFRGPFGPLFESLGGIPIYRHRRGDLVKQMVEAFGGRDEFVLVVPAEGTRSRVDTWKSGFGSTASASTRLRWIRRQSICTSFTRSCGCSWKGTNLTG